MTSIIERSDQIVNLTDLARNGSHLFERVAKDDDERLVVIRKSLPIAVVVSVKKFEGMLDKIEDLIDQVAVLEKQNPQLDFSQ